jgi:membrane-bound serine protease (ClpP class)
MVLSLLLAVLGLLAIFLEFWLPTAIMAIFGLGLVVGSISYAFMISWKWGIVLTQFEIISLIFVIRFALKVLKKRKVCLVADQENFKGCSFQENCLGKEAEVIKDLKPSGVIEIEGKHFQALSEGDYLKKGAKVTVIGGEGFHLIVR